MGATGIVTQDAKIWRSDMAVYTYGHGGGGAFENLAVETLATAFITIWEKKIHFSYHIYMCVCVCDIPKMINPIMNSA